MYRFSFAGDDFPSILLLHFYIIFGLLVGGTEFYPAMFFFQFLKIAISPTAFGFEFTVIDGYDDISFSYDYFPYDGGFLIYVIERGNVNC